MKKINFVTAKARNMNIVELFYNFKRTGININICYTAKINTRYSLKIILDYLWLTIHLIENGKCGFCIKFFSIFVLNYY